MDERRRARCPDGFLVRLARDRGGNTLAMMAIALIPITALGGSAVDTARVYIVKNRLQQACDSGVLAGRKFMDESSGHELGQIATTQAKAFFASNVANGWLGVTNIQFNPRRTDQNRVAGDARVTVPMTVMRMFAAPDVTLTVTCEARFDIADTDIMFVLDTTGSMACKPNQSMAHCQTGMTHSYTRPGSATADTTPGYAGSTGDAVDEAQGSRIAALRTAVVDFFDTMDNAKQPTTRVRYGFIPYAVTVNAGAAIRAMSPDYLAGSNGAGDAAPYQTRHITAEVEQSRTEGSGRRNYCNQFQPGRSPAAELTFDSNGEAIRRERIWNADKSACTTTTVNLIPRWTYERYDIDVSTFVSAASARNPTRVASTSNSWLGCIEEPDSSTSGSQRFDINNLPPNLNPDLKPTGRDRWIPVWPEVAYQRWRNRTPYLQTVTTVGERNTGNNTSVKWLGDNIGYAPCGKPIQRLASLSRQQVEDYVNAEDFSPYGGTAHDTGMLWATRLLARDGIFASDNRAEGSRERPKQVIVFLTDGEMEPSGDGYGLYGMESWDRRIAAGDPGLKPYHNARFSALCDKAKAMGIDVWTVALGMATTSELKSCASSSDQALATTSGTGLSDMFRRIAKAVAMLRISQ